jgi:uncharacterized membrane protein
MHRTMYRPLVAALVASPVVALAQDAQFHYIGHLGGSGDEQVYPYGIGPGPTVIGTNDFFDNDGNFRRAYQWTPQSGITQMPGTSPSVTSGGYAMSPDGRVMVGVIGMIPGSGGPNPQVFRRVDGGPNEVLPLDPGMTYPQVTGISDDASTVVGFVNGFGGGGRGVVWNETANPVMLPTLPGAPAGPAYATNADGSVVVGWSGRGYPFDQVPVRWVDGEVESLGLPPGLNHAWASGVSADGRVIVGSGLNGGIYLAWRWTEETGYQMLAPVQATTTIAASGISADGRLIVGRAGNDPVVWKDGVPYRMAGEIFPAGATFAPFNLIFSASVISRDGRYIAGASSVIEGPGDVDYHSWLVELPDWLWEAPCAADLTGDGLLNFFDVDAFLGLYLAQDPAADLLADGVFNFFDVQAFLTVFGQGCP